MRTIKNRLMLCAQFVTLSLLCNSVVAKTTTSTTEYRKRFLHETYANYPVSDESLSGLWVLTGKAHIKKPSEPDYDIYFRSIFPIFYNFEKPEASTCHLAGTSLNEGFRGVHHPFILEFNRVSNTELSAKVSINRKLKDVVITNASANAFKVSDINLVREFINNPLLGTVDSQVHTKNKAKIQVSQVPVRCFWEEEVVVNEISTTSISYVARKYFEPTKGWDYSSFTYTFKSGQTLVKDIRSHGSASRPGVVDFKNGYVSTPSKDGHSTLELSKNTTFSINGRHLGDGASRKIGTPGGGFADTTFDLSFNINIPARPKPKKRQASFDCSKAAAKIEKMICSSDQLSEADYIMGKFYFSLRDQSYKHTVKDLKTEQVQWLKQRSNQCQPLNITCLLAMYTARINTLEGKVAQYRESSKNMIGEYRNTSYSCDLSVDIYKKNEHLEYKLISDGELYTGRAKLTQHPRTVYFEGVESKGGNVKTAQFATYTNAIEIKNSGNSMYPFIYFPKCPKYITLYRTKEET